MQVVTEIDTSRNGQTIRRSYRWMHIGRLSDVKANYFNDERTNIGIIRIFNGMLNAKGIKP